LAGYGADSSGQRGMLSVRYNDGTGSGFAGPDLPGPVVGRSFAATVAPGDLDGDGILELIVAEMYHGAGPDSLAIWRRTAGSGPLVRQQVVARSCWGSGPVAVADLNGDGVPDLASVGEWQSGGRETLGQVDLHFNDGTGRLNTAQVLFQGLSRPIGYYVGAAIVAGDLDGDGDTDLAAMPSQQVYLNTGAGQFASPSLLVHSNPFVKYIGDPGLAAGDFDGNQTPDLLFVATEDEHQSIMGMMRNQQVLGVGEGRSAGGLALYPNPAAGQVRVTLDAPGVVETRVEVLDGLGRIVRTGVVAAGQREMMVPLAGLPAGIYSVRVGVMVGRLVVE
ncbi:MAG TPA: T9SS type A sorting domain-containing protein, partial [bacterium]|nr:T9SS type A sorting domain-containing protein [bacterium]